MSEDKKGPELGTDGRPLQIFTPGIASPPPYFAGRDQELGILNREVARMMATGSGGQPIFLFGPRGMGKTVLLEEFENKPSYDADVRCVDPATGLADINNIPRMLLSEREQWSRWRRWMKKAREKMPSKASVGVPGVAGIEFEFKGDMNEVDCAERIKGEIIMKCAERPMVLVVDEAHTLKEGAGGFFLNYVQGIIKNGARLLLVLAGTPNLRSAIHRIGASFIGRGDDVPVGVLSDDAARDSIKIPIEREKVSIGDDVLDLVVDDSMGYPFFLQVWGKQLWEARKKSSMDAIGMTEYEYARCVVEEKKANHYRGYFNEISDPRHLVPAAAIARAFNGMDAMESDKAFAIVFSTTDASLSDEARGEAAGLIMERLKAKDVLWDTANDIVAPALPSFHTYILGRAKKREAYLRQFGGQAWMKPEEPGPAPDVEAAAAPSSDRSGAERGDGGLRRRGRTPGRGGRGGGRDEGR